MRWLFDSVEDFGAVLGLDRVDSVLSTAASFTFLGVTIGLSS
jgi:hypothetical protein